MDVRIYQINANRDFLGLAYTPLWHHQTHPEGKHVDAQFYDLVYEGSICYEDFMLGYYTFEHNSLYPERHVYISDVVEVLSSSHMELGFYYIDPGDEHIRIDFDPSLAHTKQQIRVVLVKPGEEAQIAQIDTTKASFEDLLGGIIGVRQYRDEYTQLVYCYYGREMKMTTSRLLFSGPNSVEAIQGPFFICHSSQDSYESLPTKQAQALLAEMKYPQSFHKIGHTISAKTFVPKRKSKSYER